MSTDTKAKRGPRPVKPKIIPAAVKEPVESAPAAPAEVAPAEVTPAATPAVASVVTPTKTRIQTNKAIGVSISAARTRRHIDKLNLNFTIDSLIGELKALLAPYKLAEKQLETGQITKQVEKKVEGKPKMVDGKLKPAEDKIKIVDEVFDLTEAERASAQKVINELAADVPVWESKIAALSRERTRFSSEASIVLSIICDELIQQVVGHTMDRVLAAKKKIIQVVHLHEPGIEALSLYPLIAPLPTFKATADKLAKTAQEEKMASTLAAALAKAEKDFKKKYEVKTPKKKEVAPPVASADPEPVENDDVECQDCKTSFRFYVQQVCNELRNRDAKYKYVRISTDIRAYLSDLLIEFIQRISPLISLTANSMKNKTVNDVAIMRTIEKLLIDGHTPVEKVNMTPAQIPDPAVVKAEVAKRDEEKKAGREYKIEVDKIPKVSGFIAYRNVSFPTSGYDVLAARVAEKIAVYNNLPQKEKAAVAAALESELASA